MSGKNTRGLIAEVVRTEIESILRMYIRVSLHSKTQSIVKMLPGVTLVGLLVQPAVAAPKKSFCETDAGKFLAAIQTGLIGVALTLIVAGIFGGAVLKAIPYSGSTKLGNQVLRGVTVSILAVIILISLLTFALKFSGSIDPSDSCGDIL